MQSLNTSVATHILYARELHGKHELVLQINQDISIKNSTTLNVGFCFKNIRKHTGLQNKLNVESIALDAWKISVLYIFVKITSLALTIITLVCYKVVLILNYEVY